MAREIQIIGITADELRDLLKEIVLECLQETNRIAKANDERPITIAEVVKMIGVSRPTLCKYVSQGLIRRHDLGKKKKVFYRSELEEDIKNIETIMNRKQ